MNTKRFSNLLIFFYERKIAQRNFEFPSSKLNVLFISSLQVQINLIGRTECHRAINQKFVHNGGVGRCVAPIATQNAE